MLGEAMASGAVALIGSASSMPSSSAWRGDQAHRSDDLEGLFDASDAGQARIPPARQRAGDLRQTHSCRRDGDSVVADKGRLVAAAEPCRESRQ
jgi:hypothetical protein